MESTIKKYTNSKGVSHDAHFNARGKYIGSVKKLGPVPIQLVQIAIAFPVQENKLRDHNAKIQELENKQLREHISKIEQQMANLYVIKNG
tara:strand:- start:753 stop:1022 length:270 start_codon:yes stop_codon:yes gene_type:complete